MQGGQWSTSDPPIRAGAYFNFIAALQSASTVGVTGICALVGQQDWGPMNTPTLVYSEGELTKNFGPNAGLLRDAALAALDGFDTGGATGVLLTRIDASAPGTPAAFATVTLDDAVAADALTLTGRYKGSRPNAWTVSVTTNVDNAALKDITIFESGAQVAIFRALTNTNTAMAAAINATNSPFVTAAVTGTGSRALANVAGATFTGGTNGVGSVLADWTAAMNTLKGQDFAAIDLVGITDVTTNDAFATWIDNTMNAKGARCFGVVKGAASETYNTAKLRSIGSGSDVSADSANVVNLGCADMRRLSDGVTLTPAQIAPRLAGAIAGTGFRRSLTNVRWTGYQMVNSLLDSEYDDAIRSGVFLFSNDNTQRVAVEMGCTSLNTLSQAPNRAAPHKKIRAVAVEHFIERTFKAVASDDYVGQLVNTDTGKRDLIGAFGEFIKGLEGTALQAGSTVEMDTQFLSVGNAVFIKVGITHADTVERIFFTIRTK